MNQTECYFCQRTDSEPFLSENGFRMVKCSGCGLLYVSPRPNDAEIAEATRQGLHPGDLKVTGQFNPFHFGEYKRTLRILFGNSLRDKERTWLDVGCGYGEFLDALKFMSDGKVHAVGSEPNEHKQKAARDRGHDVSFFPLDTHPRTYDVISMLNVYSHIPDPPQFISMLKQRLNPKGILVLQTGDVSQLTPKTIFKPLALPDHLSFATEEIVTTLLKRAGFEILKVQKNSAFPPFSTGARIVRNIVLGRMKKAKILVQNFKTSSQFKTDMWVVAQLK